MRWDVAANWYWYLSAACLALCVMVAPDYIPIGLPRAICFWGGLTGALMFGLAGFRGALRGETASKTGGHRRRVISLYGMLVCGIGFVGFAAAHFMPPRSNKAPQGSSQNDGRVVKGDEITLHDLFISDLNGRSYNLIQKFVTPIFDGKSLLGPIEFEVGLYGDFQAKSQFMALYLPGTDHYKEFLVWFTKGYKDYLYDAKKKLALVD